MRTARAAIAIAALALAQGCSTPCEDLANRICGCLLEGPQRDTCEKQVQAVLERDPKPDSTDESFCEAKLATCPRTQEMCDQLSTCQGKVNCGMAYPDPADPTGATCLPDPVPLPLP